jgi:glycosidase
MSYAYEYTFNKNHKGNIKSQFNKFSFVHLSIVSLTGLKLIMDMVPNHSSDEHEWFVKSVAREDPYTDYYTWLDPSGYNSSTGEPLPPNNWLSVFGGSAWTWNEVRQQFYYHQFHAGQPDLNFRVTAVLEEIKVFKSKYGRGK